MESHDLPPEALEITPAVMMALLTRAANVATSG
jgi:hypothetical protein